MAAKKKKSIKEKISAAERKARKSGVLPYLTDMPELKSSIVNKMGKGAIKKTSRKKKK